jgi:hypothetical protein
MANLQLERRAQKRRALTDFTVPEFPKLPDKLVRAFGLREYEADVERFRQQLQSNIQEALLSVKVE